MKYFQKVIKQAIALIYGIYCLVGVAYAVPGNPDVKVDGYNEVVSIWHQDHVTTGFLTVNGAYGTSSPTTTVITDPSSVHAFSPVLAASHSNTTATTAVAVWKAYDLTTGDYIIQAAVASTSGWTANSGVTLSDSVNEIPQDEYRVDISDDGSIIGVQWVTYLIATGDIAVRRVVSTDGGSTWSSPMTL